MSDEPSQITYRLIVPAILTEVLEALRLSSGDRRQALLKDKFRDKGIEPLVTGVLNNANPAPIRSVLRIVTERFDCFGILEEPYIDLEEWSGYSAFYSRSFMPHSRMCWRYHFFEGPVKNAEALLADIQHGLLQVALSRRLEELGLTYRGFLVLRSGDSYVVGRTAIEFDERGPDQPATIEKHPLELTGHPFCTGKIPVYAHLSGIRMELAAPPFIQQNPAIGKCSTASVWTASQILSHRFGLHKFPYDTITQQGLSSSSSPVVLRGEWKFGKGLTVYELRDALSWTGANATIILPASGYGRSAQARMRLLLYTYVESGLPVILTYKTRKGSHAVTIVGHLLPSGKSGPQGIDVAESQLEPYGNLIPKSGRSHHVLGLASQLYYAHNDAYGPYDRIHVLSDTDASQVKATVGGVDQELMNKAQCVISRGRESGGHQSLSALIVPVPPYVQNSPEPVLLDAVRTLGVLFPPKRKERILWRCFLALSPDFKQSLVGRGFPDPVRSAYMSLHLPLYIWVVEFTICSENEPIPFERSRRISGEFLYDSTTAYYSPYCLTQRVGAQFRDCRDGTDFVKMIDLSPQLSCFVPESTR